MSNICDGLGIAVDDPRGLTLTGGLPYFGGPGKAIYLLSFGLLIMLISVLQPGGIMALAQRGRRRTG